VMTIRVGSAFMGVSSSRRDGMGRHGHSSPRQLRGSAKARDLACFSAVAGGFGRACKMPLAPELKRECEAFAPSHLDRIPWGMFERLRHARFGPDDDAPIRAERPGPPASP